MHNLTTNSKASDEPDSSFKQVTFLLLLLAATTLFSCRQKMVGTNNNVVNEKPAENQPQKDTLLAISNKKKIYLTFDDGPNRGTAKVHAILREANIKASFFIVGKHVFDSPDQHAVYKALLEDANIELCNHSYTHAFNKYSIYYSNPQLVAKDFEKSRDLIPFKNFIARMPGRNAWRIDSIIKTDDIASRQAVDATAEAGFKVMGWDLEWHFDHKSMMPSVETDLLVRQIANMLEAKKTRIPDHLVLLAHDQEFQKDSALLELKKLITELKNNPDYELVLASKYPGSHK